MKTFKLLTIVFFILILTQCQSIKREPLETVDISDLDITPQTQEFYKTRQNRLLNEINEGIIIVNANAPGYNGGRHGSKVATNFYYLTGIIDNDLMLVLSKDDNFRAALFVNEQDLMSKIFYGEKALNDEFRNRYNIDTLINFSDFIDFVARKIGSKKDVYFDFNDTDLGSSISAIAQKTNADETLLKNVQPLLAEMRIFKDSLEIKRLQKAIDITGNAFKDVCKSCNPQKYEFEMEALIEYNFEKFGAAFPGFTSIVGAGNNSTILHYAHNTAKMNSGEVLLMDIGAEYGYYTADISRTIPVNGKFNPEQREIYDLVLKAQKAAISEMKPGNFINSGHFKSNEILIDGLMKLGLITNSEKEWQRKFYIHYPISHYLGMNVHDVGDYGKSMDEFWANRANTTVLGRPLEPGMVLTVEPGLYFKEDGLEQIYDFYGKEIPKEEIDDFISKVAPVFEKYKKIGIRIEDDVLITENGNLVLSRNIPKEVNDIENLMKK